MNALSPPDIDALRTLLSYEPETGVLTWLPRPLEMFSDSRIGKSWNSRRAGKQAGGLVTIGYLYVNLFGRLTPAHRLGWALHYGEWPNGEIDHINGDRTDNRITNLRDVTRAENCRNMKRPRNNTSGVVGVHWSGRDRRWKAQINENGRLLCLGHFTDFDAAVAARRAAEREFGYHQNHGRSR